MFRAVIVFLVLTSPAWAQDPCPGGQCPRPRGETIVAVPASVPAVPVAIPQPMPAVRIVQPVPVAKPARPVRAFIRRILGR